MTAQKVDEPGNERDEPTAVAAYLASGRTLLYHIGGARMTSDVVFTERRLIFPYYQRIWRLLVLAALVWIAVEVHGISSLVRNFALNGG